MASCGASAPPDENFADAGGPSSGVTVRCDGRELNPIQIQNPLAYPVSGAQVQTYTRIYYLPVPVGAKSIGIIGSPDGGIRATLGI